MIRSGLANVQQAKYTGYSHQRDNHPRDRTERPAVDYIDEGLGSKSDFSSPLKFATVVNASVKYKDIFGKKLSADEKIYLLLSKQFGRNPKVLKNGMPVPTGGLPLPNDAPPGGPPPPGGPRGGNGGGGGGFPGFGGSESSGSYQTALDGPGIPDMMSSTDGGATFIDTDSTPDLLDVGEDVVENPPSYARMRASYLNWLAHGVDEHRASDTSEENLHDKWIASVIEQHQAVGSNVHSMDDLYHPMDDDIKEYNPMDDFNASDLDSQVSSVPSAIKGIHSDARKIQNRAALDEVQEIEKLFEEDLARKKIQHRAALDEFLELEKLFEEDHGRPPSSEADLQELRKRFAKHLASSSGSSSSGSFRTAISRTISSNGSGPRRASVSFPEVPTHEPKLTSGELKKRLKDLSGMSTYQYSIEQTKFLKNKPEALRRRFEIQKAKLAAGFVNTRQPKAVRKARLEKEKAHTKSLLTTAKKDKEDALRKRQIEKKLAKPMRTIENVRKSHLGKERMRTKRFINKLQEKYLDKEKAKKDTRNALRRHDIINENITLEGGKRTPYTRPLNKRR